MNKGVDPVKEGISNVLKMGPVGIAVGLLIPHVTSLIKYYFAYSFSVVLVENISEIIISFSSCS